MSKNSIKTVSTSEVMASVAEQFGDLPKKLTKELISDFLALVESNVIEGNKVRLDKIGILATKKSEARRGRNPQTGVEMLIPASTKVSFRAAKNLKDQVIMKGKS